MIALLCSLVREFNTAGESRNSRALRLARYMIMTVAAGWRLVCSADISAKYHSTKHERYPVDLHSWYCIYPALLPAFILNCQGFSCTSLLTGCTWPPSTRQVSPRDLLPPTWPGPRARCA